MKALTTWIYEKSAGSDFDTRLTGRLYKGRAPEGTPYPYAVFFVVSETPDPVFAVDGEDVLLQFSIFSSASSSEEVEDLCAALKALYDDATAALTETAVVWMRRHQGMLSVEDHTTPDGTAQVWHYAVDYLIITQAR